MKKIEVSDEVYAALERLAGEVQRSPADVLESLLGVGDQATNRTEPIAAFLTSAEFRGGFTDAERYLALLSWIAARHPGEFSEFIRAHSGNGDYLSMTREEILDRCRRNEARQIDGTQYWAIMNIPPVTKRQFLARLLEFIGYRDAVIEIVCNAFDEDRRGVRRRSAVVAC
jgi:negative regulator of replication initiation